jgi:hypothetical protein
MCRGGQARLLQRKGRARLSKRFSDARTATLSEQVKPNATWDVGAENLWLATDSRNLVQSTFLVDTRTTFVATISNHVSLPVAPVKYYLAVATSILMIMDTHLPRRILESILLHSIRDFLKRHPVTSSLLPVHNILHLLRIKTKHPEDLIALLNWALIPPHRILNLRPVRKLDVVIARFAFIRAASMCGRFSQILPIHRRARKVPSRRKASLPQGHHAAGGLGVCEDGAVELNPHAAVGGQDIDTMEWIFGVIDDLHLLLKPLVQGFEIDLDETRELGVEGVRYDEDVNRLAVGG